MVGERKTPRLVVALTGGIASGKSAASGYFSQLGVPVIDTDVIAHQIVEPGSPTLEKIQTEFGSNVIEASGKLNRTALRRLVFSDPKKRKRLEAIMHPTIMSAAASQISDVDYPYCIVVIPLLAEVGVPEYVDRVLIVVTDSQKQLQRLINRDEVSLELARSIINAQATDEQRMEIADDICNNDGTLRDLFDQVAELHQFYLSQAQASL